MKHANEVTTFTGVTEKDESANIFISRVVWGDRKAAVNKGMIQPCSMNPIFVIYMGTEDNSISTVNDPIIVEADMNQNSDLSPRSAEPIGNIRLEIANVIAKDLFRILSAMVASIVAVLSIVIVSSIS